MARRVSGHEVNDGAAPQPSRFHSVGFLAMVLAKLWESNDQNQFSGDRVTGNVKMNVEPFPTALSTQIFPP